MQTKICSKCYLEKPIDRFSPVKNCKFGIHNTCKVCRSKDTAKAIEREQYILTYQNIDRYCTVCDSIKPTTEFTKDSRKVDVHSNICKECRKTRLAQIKSLNKTGNFQKDLLKFSGRYCRLCKYDGFSNPTAMEFHNPNGKDFTLSTYSSWRQILPFLNGCIFLCSNCHKGIHDGVFILPK